MSILRGVHPKSGILQEYHPVEYFLFRWIKALRGKAVKNGQEVEDVSASEPPDFCTIYTRYSNAKSDWVGSELNYLIEC